MNSMHGRHFIVLVWTALPNVDLNLRYAVTKKKVGSFAAEGTFDWKILIQNV